MSYSADDTESYRRAAVYVDKILKGTKAADLPVEQPMRFEFVVNLITAKQIGVTIEPNVLVRANRVIREGVNGEESNDISWQDHLSCKNKERAAWDVCT